MTNTPAYYCKELITVIFFARNGQQTIKKVKPKNDDSTLTVALLLILNYGENDLK